MMICALCPHTSIIKKFDVGQEVRREVVGYNYLYYTGIIIESQRQLESIAFLAPNTQFECTFWDTYGIPTASPSRN